MKKPGTFFFVAAMFFIILQDSYGHDDLKDIAPKNMEPAVIQEKQSESSMKPVDWGSTGSVTGQLMIRGGGPMAGGQVFFFDETGGPPPSKTRYWTVPDYIAEIGSNGRFSAELPKGKYYVGAIKRVAGDKFGPPREGDLLYVRVDEAEKPKLLSVGPGDKIDIGIISEAEPFSLNTLGKEKITAIEGSVIDVQGKPVEGAMIFAFPSPNMIGRPLFISDRTDKKGNYQLRVSEGGKYYLRVRSDYGGGPPSSGDVLGSYGDKEPMPAIVETGAMLKGIDIRVIRFPGRGREGTRQGP